MTPDASEAAADPARAALLLAAADGLRERLGTPREPQQRAHAARTSAAARAALGGEAFAAAQAEGRALDFAGALAAGGVVGGVVGEAGRR